MRNCWLTALAGQRADAPSNISHEGPTGMVGGGGAWPGNTQHQGTAGVKGAGGSGGPGWGAGGRWRGLAGLRADAPSEARGADGSRAGRRPRAHRAARPAHPTAPETPAAPQQATSNKQQATHTKCPPGTGWAYLSRLWESNPRPIQSDEYHPEIAR